MKKDEFEDQILKEFKSLNGTLDLINKQFMGLSRQLTGIANTIHDINPHSPFDSIRGIISGFDNKEHKEETLLNLQIEALKQELEEKSNELEARQKNTYPRYDPKIPALIINNTIIELTADTIEARTCSVIFKNQSSMKKLWSWDELVEAWVEEPENYTHKTIYMAGTRLNQKIAASTSIKEFFIVKTLAIQVNPSLLK